MCQEPQMPEELWIYQSFNVIWRAVYGSQAHRIFLFSAKLPSIDSFRMTVYRVMTISQIRATSDNGNAHLRHREPVGGSWKMSSSYVACIYLASIHPRMMQETWLVSCTEPLEVPPRSPVLCIAPYRYYPQIQRGAMSSSSAMLILVRG